MTTTLKLANHFSSVGIVALLYWDLEIVLWSFSAAVGLAENKRFLKYTLDEGKKLLKIIAS